MPRFEKLVTNRGFAHQKFSLIGRSAMFIFVLLFQLPSIFETSYHMIMWLIDIIEKVSFTCIQDTCNRIINLGAGSRGVPSPKSQVT